MKLVTLAIITLLATLAHAATWVTAKHNCPNNLETTLQLRDGRLLISNPDQSGTWLLWTPDEFGSYENGTCTRAADSPNGYAPRAFGSVVSHKNGRVYVFGGEYNERQQVWTNKSAVYTPDNGKGTWRMIDPPAGWLHIGDAPALELPNDDILQLNCCTNEAAIFHVDTETWTPTGNTLLSHNNEVLTVLRQDGKVSMLDTQQNFYCGLSDKSTEIYDPATGVWSCGPQTPVKMWELPDNEAGPALVLTDGRVLQTGGNVAAAATLNQAGTFWVSAAAPDGMSTDDTPCALLPDGTVLCVWRTLDRNSCQFKVYDPAQDAWTDTQNYSVCPNRGDVSFLKMTVIPTGQVVLQDQSHWPKFYSSDTTPLLSAGPKILALSTVALRSGNTYTLFGKQLNGVSCASVKDDDAQQCTNYPLVQLMDAYGHVTYAPTHDDSYSGITPNTISYTKFDVPANITNGIYTMRVVANGIPSLPVSVAISAPRL